MSSHGIKSDMRDVLVVGGGFGGLSTARALAKGGVDVVLCEGLNYLGGCASTFSRKVDGLPMRFESGATLFSGLGDGGYYRRRLDEDGIDDVGFTLLDPIIEVRAPGLVFPVSSNRAAFVETAMALPGAHGGVRDFLHLQQQVADVLWPLFDDVTLLPPFSPAMILKHAARLHRYPPVLSVVLRDLGRILRRFRVDDVAGLMTVWRGLCQITVQTRLEDAEAPFALASMDYPFRGTGHVDGGVGRLAAALGRGIERHGGEVKLSARVKSLQRIDGGWRAKTLRGDVDARSVVLNLLPADAARLVGVALDGAAARLQERVSTGWSAVMLYLVVEDDAQLPAGPHHLELIDDGDAPFVEGNHVFVSIAGRDDGHAPAGLRAVTCSTHLALERRRGLSDDDAAVLVEGIQGRMRAVIARHAPELQVRTSLTASARTWQRFVGRSEGAVGGPPRLAGLSAYADMGPAALSSSAPDVWLVGDSAFPGQSTLATSVGGERLASFLIKRGSSRGAS